jgi:hypothetical protein
LNQLDDDEKTANVPKMREVYMKATLTISWLGPAVEGIAAAFSYASQLCTTYIREMAEQKQIVLTPEQEKEKDVRVKVKLGDPALETLIGLLERPYFERAWIMQEVVVSSNVWFMCGSATIKWDLLLVAYLYLITSPLWIWEFYHGNRIHIPALMKLSEMEWVSGADTDWFGMLLRHRMCLSGDPRDKVYAFYGMRCKKSLEMLGVEPDYDPKTTTEVVYIRLAARALHKAQVAVLHVPRLVTTSREESDPNFKRLTLPSWVPDWRWTEATPMSLVFTELSGSDASVVLDYHASKDSDFEPGFDVEAYNTPSISIQSLKQSPLPKMLRLFGVTVAKITQLTPRPWISRKTSLRQSLLEQAKSLQFGMHQVHEWEFLFRPRNATQIYPATGELAMRAMYETFMAGDTQNAPEIKLSASVAFERRQRILRLFYIFHVHGFLICYIVVILVERVFRRFGWVNPEVQFRNMVGHVTNRKGAQMVDVEDSEIAYHALVPSTCRLGDHVVLVGGVMTPLILRGKGGGTITTWEFVGDAYVHGIMKGELWEERKGNREDMWVA